MGDRVSEIQSQICRPGASPRFARKSTSNPLSYNTFYQPPPDFSRRLSEFGASGFRSVDFCDFPIEQASLDRSELDGGSGQWTSTGVWPVRFVAQKVAWNSPPTGCCPGP